MARTSTKSLYSQQIFFYSFVLAPLITLTSEVLATLIFTTLANLIQYFSLSLPLIGTFFNYFFTVVIVIISLLPAFIFGLTQGKRHDLPTSFIARYLPIFFPLFFILPTIIIYNFITQYQDAIFISFLLGFFAILYLPFIIGFKLGCFTNKKYLKQTKYHSTFITILIIFALIIFWQLALDHPKVLTSSQELTINEEVILEDYRPSNPHHQLPPLSESPQSSFYADFPILDGDIVFYPLYAAMSNQLYQTSNKQELDYYLTCTNSDEAYVRLLNAQVDLIFVTFPSLAQTQLINHANAKLTFTPIAKDALVFFVNRHNLVNNLSLPQIKEIYQKRLTNWVQVGGLPTKILPFQQKDGSLSQTLALNYFIDPKNPPSPIVETNPETNLTHPASYRNYLNALGYSLHYFTQNYTQDIKLLSLNHVAPTLSNIQNDTYPLTIDIYAVTSNESNPLSQYVIEWLLSPQGQSLIKETGYIPLD
jgi:phosphate transport system substrate-binding protein